MISSEGVKAGPFLGNGVATVFSFAGIKVFKKTDLLVTKTDALSVDSNLTVDVDFSVSLNADQQKNPGGSITYPISGSPLAGGAVPERLTILNEPDFLQQIDLRNASAYDPPQLEDGLDLMTILAQRAKEASDRSLKIPASDNAGLNQTLPGATSRASKFLGFDSLGNAVVLVLADATLIALGNADVTSQNTTFNKIISDLLAYQWEQGRKKFADLASATTVNIGAANGHYGHITGNVEIEGFDTVQAGITRAALITGTPNFKHNGTSFINLTGADILGEAGDIIQWVSEGSGNWRMTKYLRASGKALIETTPEPNPLINGSFQVAQRGTNFNSTTTPANNDDTYLLDRWILLSDGNDIVDVSQETTTVPSGSYAACKSLVATINKKFGFLQILEGKDAAAFIGQTVTLSFKARTNTGAVIENLRAHVLAWGGTEDVVTSDVVAAWGAEGANPTFSANWTAENVAANLAVAVDSFTTHSIAGISIDTAGAKNIAIFIHIDDTDAALNDVLFLTDVKLEIGSNATTYQGRSFSTELALCQRYYAKTFNQATAPAQNAGLTGALNTTATSTGKFDMPWHYPARMRAVPTFTFYNPSAANASARNSNDGTDTACVADQSGEALAGIRESSVSANDANDNMYVHATIDAEL